MTLFLLMNLDLGWQDMVVGIYPTFDDAKAAQHDYDPRVVHTTIVPKEYTHIYNGEFAQ